MDFSNEAWGVSFSLPDKVPVRKQLTFRAEIAGGVRTPDVYERFWGAAVKLVENWQCDRIPDPAAVDLDAETDPVVANIVQWVSDSVAGYMFRLEETPKN